MIPFANVEFEGRAAFVRCRECGEKIMLRHKKDRESYSMREYVLHYSDRHVVVTRPDKLMKEEAQTEADLFRGYGVRYERDYSQDTMETDPLLALKQDGTPRLLQPNESALAGLMDFIGNCVDDADGEDREDLNEMSGVIPELQRRFEAALDEVLSAYVEASWTMDGVPDVGPALAQLGATLGIDVRARANEIVKP